MRTEISAEREYKLLVSQRRKSIGNYTRTAVKALGDVGRLAVERRVPLRKDAYLYEGIKALTDYCVDEGIGDVAFIDKSARPLWVGLDTYWKLAQPDRPRPAIHFINPTLYRNLVETSRSPGELQAILARAGKITLDQMSDAGSPLVDRREDPLLLADACMHSGRAVYLTKRVLAGAGFEDLHVGVVKTTLTKNNPLMPDIYGTDSVVAARCFRVDPEDSLVQNSQNSIYSLPASNSGAGQHGLQARQRIRELITECFVAETLSMPGA